MTDTHLIPQPLSIQAQVEVLLFVAAEPVSVGQLAGVLEIKQAEVLEAINKLKVEYTERGLRIQEYNHRYQLTTAPEISYAVEKLLGLESSSRLSRAALECLAVIAYRQPVTRPGIDAIRGVNSDGVLKSLLGKGLIEEVGRAVTPGRPILYGITDLFLQHFGLEMLSALPPLEMDISEDNENLGILKD